MARIKKAQVEEREEFVMNLFSTDPKMTGSEANRQLQARDGQKMNLKRLYELKKKATEIKPAETAKELAVEEVFLSEDSAPMAEESGETSAEWV